MVAPKVFEENQINNVSGFGIIQVLQLVGGFGLFSVGKSLCFLGVIFFKVE
jgi:hypothetical protein